MPGVVLAGGQQKSLCQCMLVCWIVVVCIVVLTAVGIVGLVWAAPQIVRAFRDRHGDGAELRGSQPAPLDAACRGPARELGMGDSLTWASDELAAMAQHGIQPVVHRALRRWATAAVLEWGVRLWWS